MPYDISELLVAHLDQECTLFVHRDVRVLQQAAQLAAEALRVQPLSAGRELSSLLLGEPVQARPRSARAWLLDSVARRAPGPAVLSDIDLLFEPAWALDPLALFRSAARSTRLVVAWPGTHLGGVLAYAAPDHGAYRTWPRPGVGVVTLP